MEQLEFFVIQNPCVGVCLVDAKGYCTGCMRKREERFNWLSMTPAQQMYVMKLCRQRTRRKATKKVESDLNQKPEENPQESLFDGLLDE